ncbi:TetR/AcrR family transcriptional regulator [Limnochorda pilosa]|uniref:TetR family transcriptional regulator n=1 Tax=Limnochorda pilosa TaxID=1555112 RepID=A0A0K2SGB0_LIMPI|nr:TetR/AcrR family transcriptional regulator [Limnochorda pilosa]BAS26077.1 TetR family transcriptional regulator [Limnochorda pilosa]
MHETRKEQVLEAAVHLFRAKGYHATSVQDIADAVGLRKGSLYHYIRSKEELLFEIIHSTIQTYIHRLESIAARPEPASARLAAAIEAHIKAVAQDTEGFAIFIGETRALEPEQRQRIEEASSQYGHLLERLIEEASLEGAFRPADSAMAALAILGACNWMHRWYDPQGRLSPKEIAAAFTEVFFGGLLQQPQIQASLPGKGRTGGVTTRR